VFYAPGTRTRITPGSLSAERASLLAKNARMNVRLCALLIGAGLVAGVSMPVDAQVGPKETLLQKPPAMSTYEGLKPQLSAGARCKMDALESALHAKLKTASPGTTKESLLQSAGVKASDTSEQLALIALMEAANEQNIDLQNAAGEAKQQAAQELALQQLMADTAKSEAANPSAMNAASIETATEKLPPGPCVVASAAKPTPDPKLAAFLAKRQEIQANLSPGVLAKVLSTAHGPQSANPDALLATLHAQFPTGSAAQVNLLAIVAEQEALAQLQAAMSQAQQQQMKTQLQMLQSQYQQVEDALSNIMKAMNDTQSSIVQNMKG
jgi:hypothetical protein